jgi:serine protease Do
MKNKRTTLHALVLVSAGIAAGVFGPSNFSLPLSGRGAGELLSFGPNLAQAAENFQDHPMRNLGDFNEAFSRIAESAAPSVVTIYSGSGGDRAPVTPFDSFGKSFRDLSGPSRPAPAKASQIGSGSGVIVSADGYILTNNHLVENVEVVSVRTSDNRRMQAKVVGRDAKTDIALLKVEASNLRPIVIGNSDRLRIGEWVVAVGGTLGESRAGSVSKGIVSAKGLVNVAPAEFEEFIQTDASINASNTGGPLLNINGELVGINTAVSTQPGGHDGFGFALPSNKASKVFTALVQSGKVSRGYLGIGMQDVDDNVAGKHHLNSAEGVVVKTVPEPSAAQRESLRSGDVIVEFNGRKVSGSSELRAAAANQLPGSTATVRIDRDGMPQTLDVHIEELSDRVTAAAGQTPDISNNLLGFMASPLNAETAEQLGKKAISSRVVVTAIKVSSAAYKAGLRLGDVILSIDKRSVTSFGQFNETIGRKKSGERITMLVERGWSRMYFAFNL